MIDSIVFDVGGVIVPLNRARCIESYDKLGVKNFKDSISDSKQLGFFADFENGDISSTHFRNILRKMSDRPIDDDSLIDNALHSFLEPVKEETAKCIVQLGKRYRLFILSNNNPIAWAKCKALFEKAAGVKMESVFEKIYLSFEQHQSKPERPIFETVIKDSGINPSATLYIDDATKNIDTAKELGFNTILFDISKSLKEQIESVLGGQL